MKTTALAILLLSALAMGAALKAQDPPDRIRRARRPVPNQYVVVLASNDDAEAMGRETEAVHRGRLRQVYRKALRGFSIRLSRAAAAELARDPRVLYVEEDGIVQIADVQANPTWGLDRIDQRTLPLDGFYTYAGLATPVHVHLIDTGIRVSHQEFGGRASIAGDFVDDDNDSDPNDVGNDDGDPATPDGADCHGHGTHVGGTIAGTTYGVAKEATVHSYRVLNCGGSGDISSVLAAIDAIAADTRRPAVANMSLGGAASSALDAAVRLSIASGVTYVVAAGNSNADAGGYSPSRVTEAITVGATAPDDSRASFSNFGAVLDLFAPGVAIRSAWYANDTATATANGTSMAAPHVAGVAALYLQMVGDTAPAEVRTAIVNAGTVGVVTDAGAGSPNILLYSGFTNPPLEETRVNVALATNGATATASSSYFSGTPPGATINGDRRGVNWAAGGVWNDATGNAFPDWLEVAFSGVKTIDEISVFSMQDSYNNPSDPTPVTTFSAFGARDFTAQYWNGAGWQAVPGGVVRGNTLVWRQLTFAPVTTSRIRVLVEFGMGSYSRLAEVEAYGVAGGGGPSNNPPSVSLTGPADGASFESPATIEITADATDDIGVREVTFYANDAPLNTDDTSPYSYSWSGMAPGTYTLKAMAIDVGDVQAESGAVTVTVLPAGDARVNVALAAFGATATASSSYGGGNPPGAANDGDRRGVNWAAGGVWNDATANAFPDWLEIAFNGVKAIDEISVFSMQDNYNNPSDPTPALTFSAFGARDFTAQYWNGAGWQAVPGGVVRGNTLVWRRLTFAPVTTSRIRVLVEFGMGSYSRLAEVEAYGVAGGGGPSNNPPSVSLTGPAGGASFESPATIEITADATDDIGVREVTFYANDAPLNTDDTSPYSYSWSGMAAGTYTLKAVAIDEGDVQAESGAVTVTVLPAGDVRGNVALAAFGATAAASSSYDAGVAPGAANNGDRRGMNWYTGGVWHDATKDVFPDWWEVTFNGVKTIDEVDVYSMQDSYNNPVEPTPTLTFSAFGARDFTVQYWTGTEWQAVPGGVVRGNTLVWRQLTFAPITTSRIRVLVEFGMGSYSRLAEVEAYGVAGGATATEWFVEPGGTGSGSSVAPFGRIQDALAVAHAGDMVTVRSGTYNETLSTTTDGTPTAPIQLRSAAGRGSVIVTAPGRVLNVSHAHITIDALVLDGQYGLSDAVRLSGTAHYFHLKDTEVRRSSRDLIDMAGPQGVLIENCLIHHALNAAGGRTDAHGIAAGAVRDLTIRDTEIHTFSGDGIQVDPGRSAPGWNNVTIERTNIWLAPLASAENGFAAGTVPGENAIDTKASATNPRSTMTIRDTVARGFRSGIISNMAAFNLKENIDATVDRVSVYDSEIAFRLRGAVTGGALVTIKNAVVYDVLTAFRYEDDIQNLRIWNSTVGRDVTQSFQAASSISTGLDVRNLLLIGPQPPEAAHSSNLSVGLDSFVNAELHDYRIAAGSPAIDAGVAIADVVTDRAGASRPQGNGYDVGAYESS